MDINRELKEYLMGQGASLVGFGDLSGLTQGELAGGVSVAVALPPEIVLSIADGPNMAYFDAYHAINDKLDAIVLAGERYLKERGFRAYAQTVNRVEEFGDYRTALPHKTVATASGLGWIGKSALLVTEEYGPAVRLSSLLTDAPLGFDTPVTQSRCGFCTACTDACPAGAISGKLWQAGMDRDSFFDARACRKAARRLSAQRMNRSITLCGKCFAVCPYTQAYLQNTRV